MTGRSRGAGWLPVAYALLLVVIPIGAVTTMLAWPDDVLRPAVVDASKPGTVTLASETVDDRRTQLVQLQWAEPMAAVSTGTLGGTSAVLVAPGDRVTIGSPIALVDGVQVQALPSDVAVTAPVGPDGNPRLVEAVSRLFIANGLLNEPRPRWDDDMASALQAYLEEVGAAPAEVFDPGLAVWLPVDEFPIATVNLSIGAPFPVAGQPVVTGPSRLLAVLPPEGANFAPLDFAGERPYVASLGGETIGTWQPEGPQTAEFLATLAGMVTPQLSDVELVLQLQEPVDVVTVPATALATGPGGATCVLAPDGNVVEVQPVRAVGGIVQVIPPAGLNAILSVAPQDVSC